MNLILSAASRANLRGVHPTLVLVVEQAITLTRQDFRVHDGVRTLAEQRANVARGVSRTMNSQHLPQSDGYGHAVDLVPLIDGQLKWDWPACVAIAHAVARAAEALAIKVRWGGVWDRMLIDYGGSEASITAESNAYVGRRRRAGGSALLDGPHFELAS